MKEKTIAKTPKTKKRSASMERQKVEGPKGSKTKIAKASKGQSAKRARDQMAIASKGQGPKRAMLQKSEAYKE